MLRSAVRDDGPGEDDVEDRCKGKGAISPAAEQDAHVGVGDGARCCEESSKRKREMVSALAKSK